MTAREELARGLMALRLEVPEAVCADLEKLIERALLDTIEEAAKVVATHRSLHPFRDMAEMKRCIDYAIEIEAEIRKMGENAPHRP